MLRLIVHSFLSHCSRTILILKNTHMLLQGQEAIQDRLAEIQESLVDLAAMPQLVISAHIDGITIGAFNMILTDVQKVTLTINPVDAKGFKAPVDGVPVWASSDASIATVTASDDGLSAVVVAVAPGTTQISVTADADLGAGVTALTGTLDIEVTGSAAVSLNIATGTPEAQ